MIFTPATRIFCVGLNYRDHAAEGKFDIPDFPVIFTRFPSSFVGHGKDIILPKASAKLDYEGELVAVIGKEGRDIAADDALSHIAGYTIGMDGSVRDYQRRTSQFAWGKNFDRTGALGPSVVPAEQLPAGAKGLAIRTYLNGALMQDGTTADMIFPIETLISELSRMTKLIPGDLILTGTPAGVGFARRPPVWLRAGDQLRVSIEGIGELVNTVAAA